MVNKRFARLSTIVGSALLGLATLGLSYSVGLRQGKKEVQLLPQGSERTIEIQYTEVPKDRGTFAESPICGVDYRTFVANPAVFDSNRDGKLDEKEQLNYSKDMERQLGMFTHTFGMTCQAHLGHEVHRYNNRNR